jgi:hypothetical protein
MYLGIVDFGSHVQCHSLWSSMSYGLTVEAVTWLLPQDRMIHQHTLGI